MNRLKIFVLVLGLAATLVGCVDHNGSQSGFGNAEFVSPGQIHVSFSISQEWRVVPGSELEQHYMKNSTSFLVQNEKMLNDKSLPEAVELAKEMIQSALNEVHFDDVQFLLIDGNEALGLNYTYTLQTSGMNLHMKMNSLYTIVNNECFVISFGDLENNFPKMGDDIAKIVESIHFKR